VTRALVTGGAGFIGSHTVDLLLERGYDVRVLDLLQPRVHPKGKPEYLPDDVEFLEGDVANPEHMARALEGCDAVVHLAAYQDYLPDFSRFFHNNTESTALIFELLVADPKRFPVERLVFASSQAVSGEGKYRCPQEGTIFYPGPRTLEQLRRAEWDVKCPSCGRPSEPELIDEATCNHPHTAYAVSKYAIELLAFSLGKRYGLHTAALRYTYVQGPRNSLYNAYSGVARRFAMRLRARLPPVCYEDGRQLRDYVNVKDVARANLLVLERDEANGLSFNVGGGRAVSVLELARIMIETGGADLEPEVPGEFRVGDTRHTVSDITRIRALGWEPTTPVEENVRQYLDWLETHADTTQFLEEADRVMREQGIVQRVS
jgi:dTDP-L-rhamnose 4-epimerase